MPDILIRPARAEDKPAIFAISATVWEGSDYIPRVWDTWLNESANEGFLLVAEYQGTAVAVQHAELQPGKVAWFEGIRVHPDYRNQGIGNAMLVRGIEVARELGCSRARLSTAQLNKASGAIATTNGFEEIGQFRIFSAPADAVAGQATPAEITIEMLQDLRARLNDDATLIADGWTAYDVPGQRTPDEFKIGYSYQTEDQTRGIALASESVDRNRITIAYIDGSVEAIGHLGLELRSAAQSRELETVSGMLRYSSNLEAGLTAAGYEMNTDLVMLVFERSL